MGNKPVLIYKASSFAHYYGMTDERVYIIYFLPYKTPSGRSRRKFVIGRLKEFCYDYGNEILFELRNNEKFQTHNYLMVDRCNQIMEVIKISKKISTFLQAETLLIELVNK